MFVCAFTHTKLQEWERPSVVCRSQVCGLTHLLLLQDMWLIEGALEVHLGEFHIRMKGDRRGQAEDSTYGTSQTPGVPPHAGTTRT